MKAQDIATDIASKNNLDPTMILLIVDIILKLWQLSQMCNKEPSESQMRRHIRIATKLTLGRQDYHKYGQRIEDALIELKGKYSMEELKNVRLS